MKGVEGKIIDPQPQEEGPAVGEVAMRGAVVMKGYWNRPDATAAVFRDGWFLTGDLGYFDSDGHLFLTGRKKEVIVLSNGKNVYPEEIEAHYLKSPFIKEIAVMGLEGKPGEGGDRLHAVIVPNFDALRQRKIVNAKEVIRFDIEGLSPQIASTKRIGSYEIWQEDLAAHHHAQDQALRSREESPSQSGEETADDSELPAEKPLTADEVAWLDQPNVQRGLKIVRETARTAPPAMRPTLNLELDLGLDSMQRVELLSRLEEELGGNLEESQLAEIYTVRDLLDAVLQARPAARAARERAPHSPDGNPFWPKIQTTPKCSRWLIPIASPIHSGIVVSRLIQLIALDRFRSEGQRPRKDSRRVVRSFCRRITRAISIR